MNCVLEELNLYNNEIRPDGCKMIAEMLKNKANLKVLGLS
jgi:Ran GTPase-activating protein (RanGAP) involved in mRNA processing and transport